MSYLVLARKWRPQTFEDLVGQEHIGRTIEKAIQAGRISHAFLFTGTRGVGKTTTARILAKALNCEKGPTAKPCGVCSSCKDITSGVGLDVQEIDGASNNSVEDVRSLREQIAYAAAGGKYRIVIIDEVHMLSKSAFNALLKTLEEPPPKFIFIFATTEPNKVPETILSRIQRYDFRRISAADIFRRLKFICEAEKVEFDEEALRFLAQKAMGSMRDSLTYLDRVIPYCEGKLTLKEIKTVFGLVDPALYFDVVNNIFAKNEAELMNRVAQILAEGYDLAEFVSGLEEHVRHLLLARIDSLDADTLGVAEGARDRYRKQADSVSPTDLLRMTEILSQLAGRIQRSPLPKLDIEVALLKLARMDSAVDIAALLRGETGDLKKKSLPDAPVTAAPARPVAGPAPAAPLPEAVPVSPAGPLNLLTLKTSWRTVTQNLIAESMQVGTYLSYSFVLSASPEVIRLGLPSNQRFQFEQVMKTDNMKWLENYFRTRMGYGGRIQLELVTEEQSKTHLSADTPVFQQKESAAVAPKQENINEAIKKEPILGTILDVFNGEVV